MTQSEQQKAANRRLRRLMAEREAMGVLAFERLQVRRQQAANARTRERTAQLRTARASGDTTPSPHLPGPQLDLFEISTNTKETHE